jgi:hypothetical protein
MSQRDDVIALLADGGLVRHRDLRLRKISPATIARLRAEGVIEKRAGGYGLAGAADAWDDNGVIVEAALRFPDGVLCLNSAAKLHGMISDGHILHVMAVPNGRNTVHRAPIGGLAVIRWRNPDMFRIGVTSTVLSGVRVRLTDQPRTVLDMVRAARPSRRLDETGAAPTSEQIGEALGEFAARDGPDGIRQAGEYSYALGWREENFSTELFAALAARTRTTQGPAPR